MQFVFASFVRFVYLCVFRVLSFDLPALPALSIVPASPVLIGLARCVFVCVFYCLACLLCV